MKDLVSIVVPVYNVYKYLSECINSILEQTYTNIELVLVDDGSTDGCDALCDEYEKRFKNVKVVHRENGGLGIARNTGIENSNGKYIVFVDGDDFVGPKHIENLMMCLYTTNADACYGGYRQQCRNDYTKVENSLKNQNYEGNEILNQFLPHMFGKLDYKKIDDVQMSVCMGIYSLQLIHKNNIEFHSERELISEDLVFNIDFLEKASRICVIDSCEYYYRNTEGSLTKSYRADRLERQIQFSKYLFERTQKIGIFESCEQRICSTFLSWIRVIVQFEQHEYKRRGLKKSLLSIQNICNNTFVIEIMNKYDESNLTIKLRFIHRLIRGKHVYILWLISFAKHYFVTLFEK